MSELDPGGYSDKPENRVLELEPKLVPLPAAPLGEDGGFGKVD